MYFYYIIYTINTNVLAAYCCVYYLLSTSTRITYICYRRAVFGITYMYIHFYMYVYIYIYIYICVCMCVCVCIIRTKCVLTFKKKKQEIQNKAHNNKKKKKKTTKILILIFYHCHLYFSNYSILQLLFVSCTPVVFVNKCSRTCQCINHPCDPITGKCPPGGYQPGYIESTRTTGMKYD
jgi:preprotein translocase subunit SecG